jgi:hypothetical protein
LISTFEALLVLLVAVLPGSLYTIALVHRGATWAWPRDGTADRIILFVGISAVFHACFAPATYWAYRELIVGQALADGRAAWWWWLILLAYVVVPYAWGEATARSRAWGLSAPRPKIWFKHLIEMFTATAPEPRAWDRVFANPGTVGWVRLKLASGDWKAGHWRQPSYASGYQEETDLFLADLVMVDNAGQFVMDRNKRPVPVGAGLLIRWSEVQYLEFIN